MGGRQLIGLTLSAAAGYAIRRYRQRLSPDADPLQDFETRFDRAVEIVRHDLHERGESLAPDLVRRLAPYEDATVEALRAWVRRNAQKLAEATDAIEEQGKSGRAWTPRS